MHMALCKEKCLKKAGKNKCWIKLQETKSSGYFLETVFTKNTEKVGINRCSTK